MKAFAAYQSEAVPSNWKAKGQESKAALSYVWWIEILPLARCPRA